MVSWFADFWCIKYTFTHIYYSKQMKGHSNYWYNYIKWCQYQWAQFFSWICFREKVVWFKKTHGVLLDLRPLKRTTGRAIAEAIRECLVQCQISLELCRGQAYDTTASMSSDKKGVQAEIGKYAPTRNIRDVVFIRWIWFYVMHITSLMLFHQPHRIVNWAY